MEKMMQQHEEEHQVKKMMQVCPPWLHAAIAGDDPTHPFLLPHIIISLVPDIFSSCS